MKLNRTVVVAALVAAVGIAGCEDDEVTGPVIADLAGSWEASVLRFEPSDDDSPSTAIPFIGLGGELGVTIENSGAFSGTLTVPGAVTGGDPVDLPVAGSMAFVEVGGQELLDVDFSTATEAAFGAAGLPFEDFDGPYALQGNQLTITNETDFDFDLGGPGEAEAALMTMVLARSGT